MQRAVSAGRTGDGERFRREKGWDFVYRYIQGYIQHPNYWAAFFLCCIQWQNSLKVSWLDFSSPLMHLSICVQTQPLLEEGEQLESSFSWRVKSLWLAGTLWLHVLIVQSCPTFCDPMDCSLPGFPVHRSSPGKNTRVGSHSLLHRIFLIQR